MSKNKIVISTFNYNNVDVKVYAEIYENDQNMVYSDYFCNDKNPNEYILTSIKEIIEDMNILFANLEGLEFNMQNIANTYSNLIIHHIENFGRLLDFDLEGYLNRVMHFMVSLLEALSMQPFTEIQGIEIKNEYRKKTYETYKDFIWVNKPILGSLNPFFTNELVKYTDLI